MNNFLIAFGYTANAEIDDKNAQSPRFPYWISLGSMNR